QRELGLLGTQVASARRNAAAAPDVAVFRVALAFMLCEVGEHAEATELLEKLVTDDADAVRSGFLRRYELALLAEGAHALDHPGAAAEVYAWLAEEARLGDCIHVGPNAFFGATRRYVGLLALTLGRPKDAVKDLEVALDIH